MAPRTEDQNEEIRQHSRRKILDAALEVFAQKGYVNSTMASIAKQAGVSKGLAYNYFENKEALLKEVFEEGFSAIEAIMNDSISTDPLQSLINVINISYSSFKENLPFWILYLQTTIQPDSQAIISEEIQSRMHTVMGSIIQLFTALGSQDPETEAFLFGAHFDGVLCDYMMMPDAYPIDKVQNLFIQRYTDLFKDRA
ncbi:MAG: TetR/AcrR family transcriptional regulator [Fibrobacterales bacterium]